MIKEHGEPYFPVTKDEFFWPGATLRDAFAMAAMQALLTRQDLGIAFKYGSGIPQFNEWSSPRINGADVLAELSYEAADSMLKAREASNVQA